MSFANIEQSANLGEPVQLFQFLYGPADSDVYCYTDAEQDIVWSGRTYKAVPIERSSVTASGTTDKSTLTVETEKDSEIAELFRVYPPSYTVRLIVFQGHLNDPAGEFLVFWSGKVLSCNFENSISAKLTCEPASVSMQRVGLRRSYQYMCPHVLYGDQCRANKAAHTFGATVQSVAGRFVTLVGLLDLPLLFEGGLAEWTTVDGRKEFRTILSQGVSTDGKSVLLLSGTAHTLEPGGVLLASRGCEHTMASCQNVFGNILNYGGQPYIPTKNPMGRSTPFL